MSEKRVSVGRADQRVGQARANRQPLMGGELYSGTQEEQTAKLEDFRRMVQEWRTEDPHYNEETLSWLMHALDEDRPSSRKLFSEPAE